jgi:thiamine biosynthesis lipoprotein
MSVVQDPARPAVRRLDAIGAPWAISTPAPLGPEVVERIDARIASFDETWSRFRDDSLVARIATRPGRYELPPEAGPLLDLYRRLDALTAGRVSPLVGRRLEHLGYDRDYSFRPGPGGADPAAVPRWDDVAEWDGRVLTTSRPVLLDVGAAGKGYLVDLVCAILDDAGHDDYVVDASGDLRQRGPDPARVALEDPSDATMAIGVVELSGRALCASAVNRRAWGEGLHHVIDATTGLPTADVVATWAIAPTALEADGLATALFFADPVDLARDFDLEAVRVFADGSAQYTTNFSGDLF